MPDFGAARSSPILAGDTSKKAGNAVDAQRTRRHVARKYSHALPRRSPLAFSVSSSLFPYRRHRGCCHPRKIAAASFVQFFSKSSELAR
jgi:hypothetical protein